MKYRDVMLAAGHDYFAKLLKECAGDIPKAAQMAGLARTTMYKILPKYGIQVEKNAVVKEVEPAGKYPPERSREKPAEPVAPLGFNERRWLK